MEPRDIIRKVSEKEPLNPYQIAGMTSLLTAPGVEIRGDTVLEIENPALVFMILDRTGENSAGFLLDVKVQGPSLKLFPRFPGDSLERLVFLTPFGGRRQSIRDNLIPVLYEIPNWLDVVSLISRYSMERDNESLAGNLTDVLEITFNFLYAATNQPFDASARAEGEYTLCRLIENSLKTTAPDYLPSYLPFLEKALDFMASGSFKRRENSFERRLLQIHGLDNAIKNCPEEVRNALDRPKERLAASCLATAFDEIKACPQELLEKLESLTCAEEFPEKETFKTRVIRQISLHSAEEIEKRREFYLHVVDDNYRVEDSELARGISFVRGISEQWTSILAAFQEVMDFVPPKIQEAFSEILASQICDIDRPEIKEILTQGFCRIVMRLEKTRKKASGELINKFANLLLDRAYSSSDMGEATSCLRAVEALGISLAGANYFLMAQELIEHLVKRPLISPAESKYSIEDDDTGEPLVLAEETGLNQAHVQHIKSLMSVIAASPRIYHRLIPYLIIQIEIGKTRICDEDLIQYRISSVLASNCSVTHFLIRTLIKALPYSLKDIGPLDTLRLTAAGLAKELANRGVKPIGNFLGKLRGDIHWRGSIENFYFCLGIMKYFATGRPEMIADWMPPESMPYLKMTDWCSEIEAQAISELSNSIFSELKIDLAEKDGLMALVSMDTSSYWNDAAILDFSRRMVLNIIELIKGLYTKYFIVSRQSSAGSTIPEDLCKLDEIILKRKELKEKILTPDIAEPLPAPITLTEGSEDHIREIDRIRQEQPGTPIILRAKKTGHAYAQKAAYLEERFEAFTRDLALEALQETLATSVNNTHFDVITPGNLASALEFMDHLVRGVVVNGHGSYYLEHAGRDLRRADPLGLTFDKVRDLLSILKKELDDIHSAYRNCFEEPFDDLLAFLSMQELPRKLKDLTTLKEIPDTDFFRNYLKTLYLSDLQARDGNLRVLETFIDKVELFLNQRLAESGRRVAGQSASEPAKSVPFYFPDENEISPCRIGLKALLLRFAENTPPYFVITTDQDLNKPKDMLADEQFRHGMTESVEKLGKVWGRALGDPANPALFSVRSGSRISMPGMMVTITNVGINDEIAEGLARKVGPWFAYDCYRRFLQEFSQAVFGVERDEFQEIIDQRKAAFQVTRKAHMSADQMKSLAFDYKKRVAELAPQVVEMLDNGRFLDILIHCAVIVLNSYYGQAARKFREAAGIHGNWRTPVIIQGMVYGNMELNTSGTGVVSYNPFTMDLRGDFAMCDQGTDVVDGKVPTIPVYDLWKTRESLATQMPQVWKELHSILFRTAERLQFDTRLEYTIQKGEVFILQVRKDRERKERVASLHASGYKVIAQGTGVSGKIFRGIMVTDRNQIAPFRHINKAQSIIDAMNEKLPECDKLDGFIFVVNDPIPEEIMDEVFSLPVATALVSRLGGRGAHAADISKSLGKVYVGQVRQIAKFAGKPEKLVVGDLTLVVGTKMIIHGQTGEIGIYVNSVGRPL